MQPYRLVEHLLFPPTPIDRKRLARRLEGKTVVITGASSGIGEQLAYLLADYKIHLILTARREEKLLAMQRDMAERAAAVSVYAADLRDAQGLQGLIDRIQGLRRGVDIFVSNAGHSIRRSVYDSLDRSHDYTRTMAINYFAPVQLLLAIIPILKKNQGHIINVGTVNTLLPPFPHWAAYQASKAAFDAWFRSAAPELNREGIATTTIYLPLVRTPMIAPTAAYRSMPAMSAMHAARKIGKSIYTRRRMEKPWWIIFGELGSVIFRRVWDRLAFGRSGRSGAP